MVNLFVSKQLAQFGMIIGFILCPVDDFSSVYDWNMSRFSFATSTYRHFVNYEKSDTEDLIKKKLEAFSAELRADNQYYALLLSYAGKQACKREASKRGLAVKSYLVRKGIPSKRIKVVDAGYQDEWVVELYLVINGKKGPPLSPTVERKRVQMIERHTAICKTGYDIR